MSAKSKSVLGEALGMFLYVKSANITSVSWTIKHKIKFLTSLEFELLRGVISWGPYKYFENQMEKDITDVKFKDVLAQIQATLAITIKATESHIRFLQKNIQTTAPWWTKV